MAQLPRFMIVVWRWGNSDNYRLPGDHTHLEWLLDAHNQADDRFVQVDLHAREAESPLTELVSSYLATGNVLLFLHDHQDYGYSTDFRGKLFEALARVGGNRSGQLYVRLFTGGREPIYCTPHFQKGILGTGGNFVSHLEVNGVTKKIPVVRPEKGARVLNSEHFDAVWNHYWQHSRQSEKIGYLKESFSRWAREYDDALYNDAGGYPVYLKKDTYLWKAMASFTQNASVLDRLAKNGETPSGLQDFSEFGEYIEMLFPSTGGQPSELMQIYKELREDMRNKVFYEIIENHETLTEDLYNRMDTLYYALPGENF